MASMDDANHDESGEGTPPRDRGDSGFGPPVSEFGPPLDAFGPPTGEAGPVGWQPAEAPERPAVGWQPADGPDRPSVGWQPDGPERPAVGWQADGPERPAVGWQAADAPAQPPVPAPPAQYRAPDSTGSQTVRAPGPDPRRAPGPEGETVRYSDQGGGGRQGTDQGTWWQQGAPQGPGPQVQGPVSQRPPTGPPRQVAGQSTGQQRETPRSLWDDDDLAKRLQTPREPAPAAKGSSSGSLWDDDDDLVESFGPARSTPPSGPGRSRGVLFGGVAAAVVVVAAIAAVVVFVMHGKSNPSPATPVAAPTSSSTGCPASASGELTVGNGPGNSTSGTGVIFGYWHAYLIDRSADLMRSFAAPTANLEPSAVLQQTINANVPSGVVYCVKITTLAPDQFNVDVTEHDPNGKLTVYKQLITTANLTGKTLISQINSL